MKKWIGILLLVLAALLGGCTSEQTAVSASRAASEPTEATLETEKTNEQSEQEKEETAAVLVTVPVEPIPENGTTTARRICLNAGQLRPESGIWSEGGTRLYVGVYHGSPMAYRVLSSPETQSTLDGRESLLLDCGEVLELMAFDDDFRKNETQISQPSEWQGGDIALWLNGCDFYGSSAVFSNLEQAAITETVMDAEEAVYTIGNWTYEDYGARGYVFALSAAEADMLYADNPARLKAGSSSNWWLRSSFGSGGNGAGSIHGDGHICNNSITNFGIGVSPALNIDLSKVLFVSTVGTDKSRDLTDAGAKVEDSASRQWTLTLLDPEKTVALTAGEQFERTQTDGGTVITVPYTCGGQNVTQISVMLTDKPCTDDGAEVLYYGALQGTVPGDPSGVGFFTLPEELAALTCGKEYHAYLLAEEVNPNYLTDYAGFPWEMVIPAAPGA